MTRRFRPSGAVGATPGRALIEARTQATLLFKDLRSGDATRIGWAVRRIRQHPALARRPASALVGPVAVVQRKHAFHVIALEWGYADWPSLVAALTTPTRDAIAALRGVFADGYTSEDVARVASLLEQWLGASVVAVWAYRDVWGTGGDSMLHTLHTRADGTRALGPLPAACWDFLTDPESAVAPEEFRDAPSAPYSARAARAADVPLDRVPTRVDAANYAWVVNRRVELG